MKRDEMEKLIAEVRTFKDAISFVALGGEDLQRLADFAALGASVAEPSEEEIEAMAKAMFEAEKKLKRESLGYAPAGYRQRAWGELNDYDKLEMREQVRAALLALQDRASV